MFEKLDESLINNLKDDGQLDLVERDILDSITSRKLNEKKLVHNFIKVKVP